MSIMGYLKIILEMKWHQRFLSSNKIHYISVYLYIIFVGIAELFSCNTRGWRIGSCRKESCQKWTKRSRFHLLRRSRRAGYALNIFKSLYFCNNFKWGHLFLNKIKIWSHFRVNTYMEKIWTKPYKACTKIKDTQSLYSISKLVNQVWKFIYLLKRELNSDSFLNCFSGSMFSTLLPKNINIYATTASNPTESSYACYYDAQRETYLGK